MPAGLRLNALNVTLRDRESFIQPEGIQETLESVTPFRTSKT